MVLLIVHPDYIAPGEGRGTGRDREGAYPIEYYEELLQYVKSKVNSWHALPQDVAEWWK